MEESQHKEREAKENTRKIVMIMIKGQTKQGKLGREKEKSRIKRRPEEKRHTDEREMAHGSQICKLNSFPSWRLAIPVQDPQLPTRHPDA